VLSVTEEAERRAGTRRFALTQLEAFETAQWCTTQTDASFELKLLTTTFSNLNMTNPLVGPSALRDLINPQFHQNNFPEEVYIKNELSIRLDKGTTRHSSIYLPR
jgi:hypothetical protein